MIDNTINKLNDLLMQSGEYVAQEEVVKALEEAISNLSSDTYIVEKLETSLEKESLNKLIKEMKDYVELTKVLAQDNKVTLPSGEVVSVNLIKEAVERYQKEIEEEINQRKTVSRVLAGEINQMINRSNYSKEIEEMIKEIKENDRFIKESVGYLAKLHLQKTNYEISKNKALVDKFDKEINKIERKKQKIDEFNNPVLNSSPISLALERIISELKNELKKLINKLLEKYNNIDSVKKDADYVKLSKIYGEIFSLYKNLDDKLKNRKIKFSLKDDSLKEYLQSLGISNLLIEKFIDKINNYKEITEKDKEQLWNDIINSLSKGNNLDKSILDEAKKVFDEDMRKIVYLQVKKSLDEKKIITKDSQDLSSDINEIENNKSEKNNPENSKEKSNNQNSDDNKGKTLKKYDDEVKQALYEVCIYNNIPEEKIEELLNNIILKGKIGFNDGTLYDTLKRCNKGRSMMQISTLFQEINNLGLLIKKQEKQRKKFESAGKVITSENDKYRYLTSKILKEIRDVNNRNNKIIDGYYVNKTDKKVNIIAKKSENNTKPEKKKRSLKDRKNDIQKFLSKKDTKTQLPFKDITIGDTVYLNQSGKFYKNSYFKSDKEKEIPIIINPSDVNVYGDFINGLDIISFPIKYISIYNNKTGNQIKIIDQGTSLSQVVNPENIDLKNCTIRFAIELPGEKYVWIDYDSNNYQMANLYNDVNDKERNR